MKGEVGPHGPFIDKFTMDYGLLKGTICLSFIQVIIAAGSLCGPQLYHVQNTVSP